VEFALTIGLFLAVFVALADAARLIGHYISLANGVNSGARVAMIPTASDDQIKDAVIQAIVLGDTAAIRSSVTIVPSPVRVPALPVVVTAQSSFTFNPALAALLQTVDYGTITLQQTAALTVEGIPPFP
jgi:Flp pilus assembly protein TadG